MLSLDLILSWKRVCARNDTLLFIISGHLQTATCFISSNGIKVTVEQAKCVQANAFIQAAIFQHFSFLPDAPAVFRINLNALIVSSWKYTDYTLRLK